MAKQEKAVTRGMLIGMQVVDAEGRMVGTVKDISFIVGRAGISLNVEGENGESRNIPWGEVQAVGDFVLLRPEETKQQTQQTCLTCKGPLTYIPQYQRWCCYTCKKYA